MVYAYSACYSPNPDNPPFYVDLPVAFPSGELVQEVWDRWLSFDPVVNWRSRVDNLRKLSGILLDVGRNDDYHLQWGHRLLSHYLRQAWLTRAVRTPAIRAVVHASASRWRSRGWPRCWTTPDLRKPLATPLNHLSESPSSNATRPRMCSPGCALGGLCVLNPDARVSGAFWLWG
jgi:hypothetical protein